MDIDLALSSLTDLSRVRIFTGERAHALNLCHGHTEKACYLAMLEASVELYMNCLFSKPILW